MDVKWNTGSDCLLLCYGASRIRPADIVVVTHTEQTIGVWLAESPDNSEIRLIFDGGSTKERADQKVLRVRFVNNSFDF